MGVGVENYRLACYSSDCVVTEQDQIWTNRSRSDSQHVNHLIALKDNDTMVPKILHWSGIFDTRSILTRLIFHISNNVIANLSYNSPFWWTGCTVC